MNQKRVIAAVIDYMVVCVIQAILILMFLFLLKPLLYNRVFFNLSDNLSEINEILRIITFCSAFYFLIRDVIGKKSVGKRIMKLKIINKSNGEEAGFSKRIVRNILLLLWLFCLIEILFFFVTKERLGDRIAGTDVVEQTEEVPLQS